MKRREFIITASAATVGMISHSAFADKLMPILASLPTFTFARIRYASGNWDTDALLSSVLYRSLSHYTALRTDTKEHVVGLDSQELFAFPFLYLSGNSVVAFSAQEREHLMRFLYDGGFIFVDDCNHDINGSFALTFEREASTLFAGSERLQKLASDDELYRSFFDFSGGPPATSHELNAWGDRRVHDYLQAVRIQNRLALLYSNKDYGCEWNDASRIVTPKLEESTKFGVNIIAHALTVGKTKDPHPQPAVAGAKRSAAF